MLPTAAIRPTALLLCCALLAAGCSAILPKLETPRLSLVSLQMQQATLFEQRLLVKLRVQNPNDLALPVRGLTVDFDLGGERFATGLSAQQFEVPAYGEAEFDMMITANAATVLLKLLSQDSGARRESIDYRISGKLRTSLGLLRTVPFVETGSIPLRSLTEQRDDQV